MLTHFTLLQVPTRMTVSGMAPTNGFEDADHCGEDSSFVADALPHLVRLVSGAGNDASKIAAELLCELASDGETKMLLLSSGCLKELIDAIRCVDASKNYRVAAPLILLWKDEDIRQHLPVDTLHHLVRALHCDEAIQNDQITWALLTLSKYEDLRQPLVSAGLLHLLECVMEKCSGDVQHRAATTLWNLSEDNAVKPAVLAVKTLPALIGHLAKLHREYRLEREINLATSTPVFVQLFREGTGELMENVLDLLGEMIMRPTSKSIRDIVVAAGFLPPLMTILRDPARSRLRALQILREMSRFDYLQSALLSSGSLGALVAVVRDSSPREQNAAARLIESIPRCRANNTIAQVFAGEIDAIAELSRDSSSPDNEKYFMALAYLARNSSNRKRILSTDVISIALRALQGTCGRYRRSAAILLSNLSADEHGRAVVATSGAVLVLVSMLSRDFIRERDKAIIALTNIARNSQKNKALIVASGGIEPLVLVARSGLESTRGMALFTLILVSINSNDHKQKIAAAGIVPDLVGILKHGIDDFMYPYFGWLLKSRALTLLKSLAVDDNIEKIIVAAGAIEPVAALILDKGADLAWLALSTLQNLAATLEHKKAIIEAEDCVENLVSRVQGTDEKLSIAAMKVLTNLAIRCNDAKKAIAEKGLAADLVTIICDSDGGQKRLPALSLLNELVAEEGYNELIVATGIIPVLTSLATNEGSKDLGIKAISVLARLADAKAFNEVVALTTKDSGH